jgi:hypothetical protein
MTTIAPKLEGINMCKPENVQSARKNIPRYGVYIFSITGIVFSVIVLLPGSADYIIHLAEKHLIHRKVNFYDQWMHTFWAWAKRCVSLILIFDFFAIAKTGTTLFRGIVAEMKTELSKIDFKSLFRTCLISLRNYKTDA